MSLRVIKVVISLTTAFILLIILSNGLFAQTIESLDARLTSLPPSEADHLKKLTVDLLPTVMLTNGQITTYGTGQPVIAICDAASVNLLYSSNDLFKDVEMIRMKFNSKGELPIALDLSQLQSFPKVQQIYMLFTYDACGNLSSGCLPGIIENIIQPSGTRTSTSLQQKQKNIYVLFDLSVLE
jgi:hypothetical protein